MKQNLDGVMVKPVVGSTQSQKMDHKLGSLQDNKARSYS
jgi:hypothetical protein